MIVTLSTPNSVHATEFQETWIGTGEHGAHITLKLIKPLPLNAAQGWLSSPTDDLMPDGEFHARRSKPVRFEVKRGPVVLRADKHGEYPAGRYVWRDGLLTVCMLSLMPGNDASGQLVLRPDYSTCAAMRKSPR